MPCPYFEPRQAASPATHLNARLPLIEEYDGICQAAAEPFAPTGVHRFQFCNQGNTLAACRHFPSTDARTSLRYQVAAQDPFHLQVLLIEEKCYWPHSWRLVNFRIASGQLEPNVPDTIVRAQLLAFCNSYLKQFASINETG